ncbi:MAG: hypothetical protein JSS15_04070 [Proteobacteria bacterium]|nr:hypothetical protein [Pseudomonadota bacterium]
MLLLLAALLLPPPTQEAPARGVNDAELGPAEQFEVQGPALVCFNQGGVQLESGETSYLDYMGIHTVSIRVISDGRRFIVSEGDIFASRKGGSPLRDPALGNVRRYGADYAIFAPLDGYDKDGKERLMFWVKGLGNKPSDLVMLRRVVPNVSDKGQCKRRFLYGWFFDDEPLKKP